MIRGVVFDLDHTLYDRYATLRRVLESAKEKLNVNRDMDDTEFIEKWIDADRKFVHFGWPRMFAELRAAGLFSEPAPDDETLGNFLNESFTRTAVPFPFALPTLKALKQKGLKIGLITNGKSAMQRKKLELLGLSDAFDESVVSEEFGFKKPDRRIFLYMADRLGLPPGRLLYVGDDEIKDIEGSRGAGYIPVWVRTTGTWSFPEVEKPELSVSNVGELVNFDFSSIGE